MQTAGGERERERERGEKLSCIKVAFKSALYIFAANFYIKKKATLKVSTSSHSHLYFVIVFPIIF